MAVCEFSSLGQPSTPPGWSAAPELNWSQITRLSWGVTQRVPSGESWLAVPAGWTYRAVALEDGVFHADVRGRP